VRLLYGYFLINLKSQLQYRSAFLAILAVQAMVPLTYFASPYFLIARFKNLGGWSLSELMLCFGIINSAAALSEALVRGFDMFSRQVVSGSFDRLLVRPRAIELQVLGSTFEFSRICKMMLPFFTLGWAVWVQPQLWQPLKFLTIVLMLFSGVAIFAGIFVLQATLCFWTVQGLEVANILTNGGQMTAQYPLSIYKKWLRLFFTFIIPFGCVNYLPLGYLLAKPGFESPLYAFTPLAGFLFLVPCVMIWRFGVGKYLSTGS